jgi:hypothetical protein
MNSSRIELHLAHGGVLLRAPDVKDGATPARLSMSVT